MKAVGPRFGGDKYGDDDSEKSRTKSGNELAGNETGRRNKRSVWTVTTKPYKGAHFATFPSDLITPCILAGAPAGGIVLDPFMGSGTTAAVALQHGRQYLGCELNPEYGPLQQKRIDIYRSLFDAP
jgi:DNA modification methylase